jgi:hypothetical protein
MKSTPRSTYKKVINYVTLACIALAISGFGLFATGNAIGTPASGAPIPTAQLSYNAHPGSLVTPNAPTLNVVESRNVAYFTWSDSGAVGVKSVSAVIAAGAGCTPGASYFYQHPSWKYVPSKNVVRATFQAAPGRKNIGNAFWQYAPGNTYSATITVVNAAGTSKPSSCVAFTVPQSDPE